MTRAARGILLAAIGKGLRVERDFQAAAQATTGLPVLRGCDAGKMAYAALGLLDKMMDGQPPANVVLRPVERVASQHGQRSRTR